MPLDRRPCLPAKVHAKNRSTHGRTDGGCAAMSGFRINIIFSSRFLSVRLTLCVLLGALCLLAFPRRNAQTSANSDRSRQVASGSQLPSPQGDSSAGRIASVSQRTSINQLPESGDNPGAPLSMASGDFDEDGVADLIVGFRGSGDFALSVYQGNPDSLYPDNPEARQRRSLSRSNISPSLSRA